MKAALQAALVAILATGSTQAQAQSQVAATAGMSDAAATEASSDEIIVSARRRDESLQDVPISVSAFGGEQLEAQQIENALDLQLSLPNVTFTKTNFNVQADKTPAPPPGRCGGGLHP